MTERTKTWLTVSLVLTWIAGATVIKECVGHGQFLFSAVVLGALVGLHYERKPSGTESRGGTK